MTFFLHEIHYRDLASVVDQRVTICGAGALGANLAETMARMGLRRLRVIDRDRVVAHNLSTQPWQQQDVGAPKVRVLANMLYRAVGTQLDAQHVELTNANAVSLLRESALVVDAFDNLAARGVVSAAAAELGLPCLHIALAPSGDYGCGLWDQAYTATLHAPAATRALATACNYPLTRPLALLVANAAAEAIVHFLLAAQHHSFELTLRDLQLCATCSTAP